LTHEFLKRKNQVFVRSQPFNGSVGEAESGEEGGIDEQIRGSLSRNIRRAFVFEPKVEVAEESLHGPRSREPAPADVTGRRSAGKDNFYRFADFNSHEFEHPNTLVRCLADDGWFGQIRILPPHQDEIARFAKTGFSADHGQAD
jgi:hypothetical protein